MKKKAKAKRRQAAPPILAMRDRVKPAEGRPTAFHCVDGSGAPPLSTNYYDEAGRPALILANAADHQTLEARYGIRCIETEPWDDAHTVHIFEQA